MYNYYQSNHMCNQSVSISSIRLKLGFNEDDPYRCQVPTLIQCFDAYGFIPAVVAALLAICNFISPFQHSELYLMLMQLAVAVLLALSPIKNILCKYGQSELILYHMLNIY